MFAGIEKINEFNYTKVQYYSIKFEEADVNEFLDFLNRMEDVSEISDDLSNLLAWIEEIGNNESAKKHFFRHEGFRSDATALPPERKWMIIKELEVNSLRVYCLRANESVVFLFNGGIKTENDPRKCPNVGPYFMQANTLARKIDEFFTTREIIWNEDFTDIIYDQDLMIEL